MIPAEVCSAKVCALLRSTRAGAGDPPNVPPAHDSMRPATEYAATNKGGETSGINGYSGRMPNARAPAMKSPGRPSLQHGEETVPVTIRLTALQREKLQMLGGAKWVRDRIDKAHLPTMK